MNNKEKIEAINKWQKCKFVHQLTCGKEKCNGVLEGKEGKGQKLKDINSKIYIETYFVYLDCPKCGYGQYTIPKIVYNLNYEQFEKLEKFLNE